MSEPEQVIPFDRLPERFARRMDGEPGEAAPPRPAATVVLARDGSEGMEILLLRRARSAGFVPGAYVFPGGRVDRGDARPARLRRTKGLDPEAAARRLDLPDGDPPADAYYVAGARETFEETGLLIARNAEGDPAPSPADDPHVLELRDRLLGGELAFEDVLEELDVWFDGGAMEYIAHWITPRAEPRRYDTRFFLARVPGGGRAVLARAEITSSLWLTPSDALERTRRGELPMVFPTLKTVESLKPFADSAAALEHFADRGVPTVLPELVRTRTGVGIRIPEEGEASSPPTGRSTP